MIKAIIVDDSRLARQELKFLLKNIRDIEIIGEAENGEETVKLVAQRNPELIFLDIQMPDMNGFEVLELLDEAPEVVFTTAYDNYAIKAFDFNALDYLQKPVKEERLLSAVKKVREKLNLHQHAKQKALNHHSQVFVKDGERCWFVKLERVRMFEVMDNYTRIYFDDEKPMIPKTLNYLESRLDSEQFFRANRQQIINMSWVERVEPWFSGTIRIILKDGTTVDLSRRQSILFKEVRSF